jgi:hypothetical protein
MDYALDKNGNEINIANIHGAVDEQYFCPFCRAPMGVRSAYGDRRTHFFSNNRAHPHDDECGSRFIKEGVGSDIIPAEAQRSELAAILAGNDPARNENAANANERNGVNRNPVPYIRTPRELLNFLCYHSPDTVYKDDLTVSDIIVDKRTVQSRVKAGISGINMCTGITQRFDDDMRRICFGCPNNRRGYPVHFVLEFLRPEHYNSIKEIINHHSEDKFKDVPIAAFGETNTMLPYPHQNNFKRCEYHTQYRIFVARRRQVVIGKYIGKEQEKSPEPKK